MKKKLRGHFIPNSHLDREWTLDFQKHRFLLVQFIDRLLEIFEKNPEYTFLLDSQTIPLEDYLEIRPEKEDAIKKYVRAGRLSIGPWYSAPDGQTLSGESLARNLLTGHRLGERFGGVMKIGYTPFGFTQVSQLPQIYAGFGIDFIFFYRGITKHESPSAEFLWESPDGTRATCSRFGERSRYNFFMEVWRPVVFGGGINDRIFQWEKGGVPFKRADAAAEYDHYFLLRHHLKINNDAIAPSWKKLLELELPHYTTHIIPLMQGMDTTMPDELEAEVLRRIQKLLAPGEEVFFSTLPLYVEELKKALNKKNLRIFMGEMRMPGPPSPYVTNLENVVSSRIRQKVKQARASALLQRLAEPFSAIVFAMGDPYPAPFLNLAWKYLLQCHPHDTAAGCGLDQIERDSHHRLEQVSGISRALLDESLGRLQARVDTSKILKDEIIITIFNPSPHPRTEVVDVFLDTPHNLNMPDFEIRTAEGKPARWTFVHRKPSEKTVRNNTDLTMALVGWMAHVQILAEDVPALGYKTFILRRADVMPASMERIAPSATSLENEYIRVDFNADGTLDLYDKETSCIFTDLHYFEDQGEKGTGWESRQPALDKIISSKGCPVEISLVQNTPLAASARVLYKMSIPTGIIHDDTFHYTRRGEKEVPLEIETTFTLRAGSRRLECVTRFENCARNHRLRVFFPTYLIGAKESAAEAPFDVVRRPIERSPKHPYSQTANPQYPCLRFADISDGSIGLAIITEGIHEYEATDDRSRALALTLLRSFEVTLCTVSYRWERRPDQILSHQLGAHEMRYAIYFHKGDWADGRVMQEAEHFSLPLIPTQSGSLDKPPAPDAALPLASKGFLEINPDALVLSAFKRAEDSDDLILRLYNPTKRLLKGNVRFFRPVKKALMTNMNEEPQKGGAIKMTGNRIHFDAPAKKIITIKLVL